MEQVLELRQFSIARSRNHRQWRFQYGGVRRFKQTHHFSARMVKTIVTRASNSPLTLGQKGKLDRMPSGRLMQRLHNRNEYVIGSHRALRENLTQQTGLNVVD